MLFRRYSLYFQAVSETAFNDAKELFMDAFDVNLDGKIDISEVKIGLFFFSIGLDIFVAGLK